MKRRVAGRYGDASIGGTGSGACSGLSRTNPAPCSRADQLATSARSARSPKAQESSERTWNNMVMKPHCR